MSEQDRESVERWLLGIVHAHRSITSTELIQLAKQANPSFSDNAVTLMIWYLTGEGKLRITSDNLVSAA